MNADVRPDATADPSFQADERLEKELDLYDVFAVATGAMLSSGFFLLPGLAAARAGPSVVLAYALAGLIVLPALLSKAELATAMPRAGGAYYFLDRSLGPMVGTIGGIGTWGSLVFKSAFALLGFSAYLSIFVDMPITPVALVLTGLFMVLNVVGAKETTGLQRVLVTALLAVLALFVVQGLVEVFAGPEGGGGVRNQFVPFFPYGFDGLVGTVGFVFVSYTGLTKVASVAEEIEDPDRNIPLGMLLSLVVVSSIYVVGVAIMVALVDAEALRSDLTPVATAAEVFFDWLPGDVGLGLVVVAAFAAFASTANAGLLSASRYPLAMARDGLLPEKLSRLGRFDTPVLSILLTAGAMAVILLTFDPEGVAKLASAFKLLIFAMLNLCVIVMRESRLPSYVPGFRSPLYPWMQLAGLLIPFWLIFELGAVPIFFSAGVVVVSVVWYLLYARHRVERKGAVFHVFERLGRLRYGGLEPELRGILKEKALGGPAPFAEAVAGAVFADVDGERSFVEIAEMAAESLSHTTPASEARLLEGFLEESRLGVTPVSHRAAIPHLRVSGLSEPRMMVVRVRGGVLISEEFPGLEDATRFADHEQAELDRLYAFFFLVSPKEATGTHLRILAQIATHLDRDDFLESWLSAESEAELKEVMLHEDRFISLEVRAEGPTARLLDRRLHDVDFPENTLVVLVEREGRPMIPRADTVLQEGDRLTFLGEPEGIETVRTKFYT
jgi:amino acid transporter/mannitol/fructose-specific phosphotransferase system IIA component (Ntr-type)